MNEDKKSNINKISIVGFIFAIAIFFIFFAREGSFTIQSIIPIIIVLLLAFIAKRENKINVIKKIKPLFFLNVVYIISLIINSFIYGLNGYYSIIQIAYQLIIFIWVLFIVQHDFSKKELNLFINFIIIYAFVSSVYIIYMNLFKNVRLFSITSIFGVTINKNHYAAFISIALLFNFYQLLYSGKNLLKKVYHIITFIVILIAMLFANSRGAIISVAGCILITFIQFLIKTKVSLKKIIIIICIPTLMIIFYKPIINLIPSWMYNRYFVNSYEDDSNMSRISRWQNGIEGVLNSLLIGYGPGIFVSIPEYAVTDFGNNIPASTPTHNTYLDVAVDGGIIGLGIFLYFLSSVYLPYLKKKNLLYLPIVLHVLINSMILGAGKTVYFWNINIFLIVLLRYIDMQHEEKKDIGNSDENIFIE